MVKFAFTVPGKPVPKGRPRFFVKHGRAMVYTPKETVAYEKRVRAYAITSGFDGKPWTGPVIARVRVFLPKLIKRRDDWDNIAKSALDAINGVVYVDDSQIVDARVTKAADAANPRIELELAQAEAESPAQLEAFLSEPSDDESQGGAA